MKKFFLLFFTLCLCLAASGCHGKKTTAAFSVPDDLPSDQDFELVFWAKNDTNKAQTLVYQQAIENFEALYPNIHITLRLYTNYSQIYDDVITNLSTGTTPDICITYPDHIATYMTGSNVVVPLDSLIEDPQYGLGGSRLRFDGPSKEEITPEYLSEGVIGDSTFDLPFMRSTEAMYINKTYVEKLGYTLPEILTWDFVWEVSEAALEKDASGNFRVNGQKVLIPFIDKSTDNLLIQLLAQMDAPYSTPEGEILLFNDQTKEILRTIGAHAQSGAFSTFAISGYPANFLNAGQCIFAMDSTAGATWMGCEAPLVDISPDRLVSFETVLLPIPQTDPDRPKMISQGPSICLFNHQNPHQVLASWLFAQYLLTNEIQIAYAQTEGYIPVTQKALRDPAYQAYLAASGTDNNLHYPIKLDAVQMLNEHTRDTFMTPVFNGSASLRSAAGALIEETVKSVRRKKTLDDAFLDELFENTASLYHLDDLTTGQKQDLGPLPLTAKILLGSLGLVWLCLLLALLRMRKKGPSP